MFKFQIYKGVDGKFRWRLIAKNGEIICWSEGYESKDAVLYSLQLVKKNSATAIVVELK